MAVTDIERLLGAVDLNELTDHNVDSAITALERDLGYVKEVKAMLEAMTAVHRHAERAGLTVRMNVRFRDPEA